MPFGQPRPASTPRKRAPFRKRPLLTKEDAARLLVCAILKSAWIELRQVMSRCNLAQPADLQMGQLHAQYSPEERGELVAAAGFLLYCNDSWTLPSAACELARAIVRIEAQAGGLEELAAGALCTHPWRYDFETVCIRCGSEPANWRPVLQAPACLAPEAAWRYKRPENHVCLCRPCTHEVNWHRDDSVRQAIALGIWGARFAALLRWHAAAQCGSLPEDWDLVAHPLWPPGFGGPDWESGSGAHSCSQPRSPGGVAVSDEQRAGMLLHLRRPRPERAAA